MPVMIEAVDMKELTEAIADIVVERLEPLLKKPRNDGHEACAGRKEMARVLSWSLAKVDRKTADGTIPSLLDEGRRTYVIKDVLASVKAGTLEAEEKARQRQANKQAAKTAKHQQSESSQS